MNNAAQLNAGGGIDNSGTATIAVEHRLVQPGGHASGGGIGNELGGTLTLSGSTLSGNIGELRRRRLRQRRHGQRDQCDRSPATRAATAAASTTPAS